MGFPISKNFSELNPSFVMWHILLFSAVVTFFCYIFVFCYFQPLRVLLIFHGISSV